MSGINTIPTKKPQTYSDLAGRTNCQTQRGADTKTSVKQKPKQVSRVLELTQVHKYRNQVKKKVV